MRYGFALILTLLPVAGIACPAVPDTSAQRMHLLEEVQKAPDETSARLVTNELWALWAMAPDAHAQELLDTGMERRSAYDFAGAEIAFDALTEYCPHYAEGFNQRAFVSYLRQDFATALEDLDRALEIDPQHVAALSGKALSLMGLGRTKAAHGVLRDALKLNPWLPERHLLNFEPGTDL